MLSAPLLLSLCAFGLVRVRGAPTQASPADVGGSLATDNLDLVLGDSADDSASTIQWIFEGSEEVHSPGEDGRDEPVSPIKRDTLIPANDPSLQVKPQVSTGTITKAQLAIWVAEGSTKRDLGDQEFIPERRMTSVEAPVVWERGEERQPAVEERQTIPLTAETTRIFGNQGIRTGTNKTIAGPFKMIETWAAANTLHGMRVTDCNDVVTVSGTINASGDTYKYFVLSDGELITALRIWAATTGGYERFTGFDFTTNLGNRFLFSFQNDPLDDIAISRNAGGGFIYAIHTSVVSGSIYNLGIDMVAPLSRLQYDGMTFPALDAGPVTLSNGRIITAGRLLLDNRNTTINQSAQLRLDVIETYSRAITSKWLATAQIQQALGVTVTGGLPIVGGSVTATTTIMVQGQYGEDKQITTQTAIDYGAWGTIVCPAGKVCRALAVLTRWSAFTFDFVATMKATTKTGAVWYWKNKGTYTGTDFADWTVTLGEYTVVG